MELTECRSGTNTGRICKKRAIVNITYKDRAGQVYTIPLCKIHGRMIPPAVILKREIIRGVK